jgi:hypothetical protein
MSEARRLGIMRDAKANGSASGIASRSECRRGVTLASMATRINGSGLGRRVGS